MASSLAPPAQDQPAPSPRLSVELPDSQAPTLTPPTAHSSPRHERATLPPEPADGAPTASAAAPAPPAPNPTDIAITFLLISGARQTLHLAPSTTVGRAKEAFWGAWTPENAADKPPAPSFLRVLHMGKILSDDQTLSAAKFPDVSTNPAGTIVHISIRPFGPLADEDIVKAKRRSRFLSTTNSSSVRPAPGTVSNDPEVSHAAGCCGCVIC